MEEKVCSRCKESKPKTTTYFRRAISTNSGLYAYCRPCEREVRKAYREKSNVKLSNKEWQAARLKQHKLLVLKHYSNGSMACACCGESYLEFLAIDHIEGGGNEHRRLIKSNLHTWLIKNNYPVGFRVLCHNCNMSLSFYGYCPHEREVKGVRQYKQ